MASLVGAFIAISGTGLFSGLAGTFLVRERSVAGLLLSCYLRLSLPVIGMGIALRQTSVKTTLLGFAIVVGFVILAARSLSRPTSTPTSTSTRNSTSPRAHSTR